MANDEYAYASPNEDIAMVIEEFMMSQRLGIRRDVAFVGLKEGAASSSQLIVRWGQRGRLGEPGIKPRAQAIVNELTPWVDSSAYLLPAPAAMRPGVSWFDNLIQPASAGRAKALSAMSPEAQRWLVQRELRRARHAQHVGAKKLPPGGGGLSGS